MEYEFKMLEEIMNTLNNNEDLLRQFRDCVDREEQIIINDTLSMYIPIRDNLWKIDKILENRKNKT